MGVMGQIYGSRVVIGLAAPSQGALGNIGKMLVKFNTGMYSTFAKNRQTAATTAKSQAQKELITAEGQLNRFQKGVEGRIKAGAATSQEQINKMAGGAEKTSLAAKNAVVNLGKAMKAAGASFEPKAMKGVGKWKTDAQKAAQLIRNVSNMDITHQKQVVKFMKSQYDGQARHVKALLKDYKARKVSAEEVKKQVEYMIELKGQYDEMNQVVGHNKLIHEELNKEEAKLKKNLKEKLHWLPEDLGV